MCSGMVIDFFTTSDTCRVTLSEIQMTRYELRTPQINWRCFPKGLEYPNPVVAQICLLIYNINKGWVDWLLPLHYNTGWIWGLWGRGVWLEQFDGPISFIQLKMSKFAIQSLQFTIHKILPFSNLFGVIWSFNTNS